MVKGQAWGSCASCSHGQRQNGFRSMCCSPRYHLTHRINKNLAAEVSRETSNCCAAQGHVTSFPAWLIHSMGWISSFSFPHPGHLWQTCVVELLHEVLPLIAAAPARLCDLLTSQPQVVPGEWQLLSPPLTSHTHLSPWQLQKCCLQEPWLLLAAGTAPWSPGTWGHIPPASLSL